MSDVVMTAPQPENSAPQSEGISLGKGILIILISIVVFAAVGIGAGKLFFWNNYDKRDKVQHELQDNLGKVQADPNNPLNHVQLGWSYFLVKQYDQAVGQYKQALTLDPQNYAADYDLGLSYMSLNQYDRAITAFKDAIKIVPNTAPAHLNLAVSDIKTKRYPEALKELDLAYKYNPGSPEPMYWRGFVYEQQKQYQDAFQQYEAAVNFDPSYTQAQEAYARMKKLLKK